jgi:catechol 2,3-dioxygenase-like lactoylglutathione lyase family enzyme
MSERMRRRQFLQASAVFVASLHTPLMSRATAGCAGDASPRLLHLKLQANKLDELRNFYERKLGLTISADSKDGFTLKTGPSTIAFAQAPAKIEPFYHFAFNIPENQFGEAKTWLAKRVSLLRDSSTGKDEVYFAAWNAHAVYFRDPAGNIGELIARHPLKNGASGAFSEQSLLCVSEIGLVTDDSKMLSADISKKLEWPKTGSELAFVGDGMGYLIVAPTGRAWLPDRIQKAVVAPVEVKVNQTMTTPLQWPKQPFTISGLQ